MAIFRQGGSIRRLADGSVEYGPSWLMKCTEEILCDECGEHICWAYAGGDLNGNYFQCDACREKDVNGQTDNR